MELRALLDALGSPAYVLDRRGRVRWLNAAGVELFGDRVGEHYLNVVAREDRPFSQTQFARKIVGDGPTLFDVVAVDRSGRRMTVRVSSAPLRVDDAIVGVFGVLVPLGRVDAPTGEAPPHSLTPRQLETLRLLADGLATEEVAGRL